MVDLVESGLAFVILMLSLSTFFGIAIFLYAGFVKGYPTIAGMKIRLKDFWYCITCRRRERIAQRRQEMEQIKVEQERQREHDIEIGRPPEAHMRPNSRVPDDIEYRFENRF